MRIPLKTFTQFTNTLLPNETNYLLGIQQFEDEDRLKILQLVDYNTHHIDQFTPYDTSIDKRKYNHVKTWIYNRLQEIDVDRQFNQMLEWEKKIVTDSIQAEDEKQLLKTIRNYDHPSFFFSKFYELIEHYRHFLLIRLRYTDHQLTDDFLKRYHASYLQSRQIKEKIHQASVAIVQQYAGEGGESKQWEGWLGEIFLNENLEGQIRYLALVRIVFICHNYRKYDMLRAKLDYLDTKIAEGFYYSKRLLANYYNTRLMLCSHFKEYDKAVYYGYLSVRTKTHDFILYINNLCAVLLRLNRHQEALKLMKVASKEAKLTKNLHNRIGFVAFYMEALNKNGLSKNAVQYGDSFLKGYAKEIKRYRWHLFFSVYLESLFHQRNFDYLLQASRKYQLLKQDRAYEKNANYLPVIPLYIAAAQYAEGTISKKELDTMLETLNETFDFTRNTTLLQVVRVIKQQVPSVAERLV